MQVNKKRDYKLTHECGKADIISFEKELNRSVLGCLLFENTFYESGMEISERIQFLCEHVKPEFVHKLALKARNEMHLRHVPLLLLSIHPNRKAIFECIQRADELSELIAIFWRNGKSPIPAQMKKGIADAFNKFTEYQFAKYNRDKSVKLRDVMFLTHPKPTHENVELFKKIANDRLATPDTWEVALSGGASKKETFERLIREKKLGYLALLKNLRGMEEAYVDKGLLHTAIEERRGASKVLPFRYYAAYKNVLSRETCSYIDRAFKNATEDLQRLRGKTVVLVDVSGSMDDKLSSKSDMTRMDVAGALAVILKSESKVVYSFSNELVKVDVDNSLSDIYKIKISQGNSGTHLYSSVMKLNDIEDYDRLVIITDEQSSDGPPILRDGAIGYVINVSSYKNGIGYSGGFVHIDGFSENVIRYITEYEKD